MTGVNLIEPQSSDGQLQIKREEMAGQIYSFIIASLLYYKAWEQNCFSAQRAVKNIIQWDRVINGEIAKNAINKYW